MTREPTDDPLSKSSALYAAIIGVWALSLAWFAAPAWAAMIAVESLPLRIVAAVVLLLLALFWLFGLYHAAFVIFVPLARRRRLRPPPLPSAAPAVAIYYCTYNDFNAEAATTCLEQDYPNFHVFLLDVSTNVAWQQRVDAFHLAHPDATTVIRLPPRPGFKGRSLNDCLRRPDADAFPFFAISDADGRLPPDFLRQTVRHLLADERLAFVQVNHRAYRGPAAAYGRDFRDAVDSSWYRQQIARNRYGLVMDMGHGLAVRRAAWEAVGGLPEVVQEDTAFTLRLRAAGHYGHFAEDVIAIDEFPDEVATNRRRYFRLVQADAEMLHHYVVPFLANPAVSLVERLDILLRTLRIPLGGLGLVYLLLVGLLSWLGGADGALGALTQRWDFAAWTLLTAAAPLLPFAVDGWRRPDRLLLLALRSFVFFPSLLVLALLSLVVYAARGGATFIVTGSGEVTAGSRAVAPWRAALGRLSPQHPIVPALEVAFGVVLGLLAWTSGHLTLFGLAASLALAPVWARWWGQPIVAIAGLAISAIMIVGVGLGFVGIGSADQYLCLALFAILLVY